MEHNRPWEMTCIVTGFTSKFAALQFEWAWQNTHATRHIARDVRDARLDATKKKKNAAGPSSPAKRRSRPPMSLEARLKNLFFLLNVESFKRWPLNIRFFAPDVFEQWKKHTAKMPTALRKSISVQLTPAEIIAATTETAEMVYEVPAVIQEIPVAYEDCKPHVEKGIGLLKEERRHSCEVCRKKMDITTSLFFVCPTETCSTLSHVSCLSARFLGQEGDRDAIVPIEGRCPGCHSTLKWSNLMKELSLRIRGQAELETMFKPKRKRKAGNVSEPETANEPPLGEEDEELDETWIQDVEDEGDDEFPAIETYLGAQAKT